MDFNITVLDRAEVFKDRPEFAELHEPSGRGRAGQARTKLANTSSVSSCTRSPTASEAPWTWTPKAACWSRAWMTDSFAEDIGLMEKDVILSINRQPVTSVEDVKKIQGTLKPGDAVAFHIMRPSAGGRGHAPQWTTFFVSGALPTQ